MKAICAADLGSALDVAVQEPEQFAFRRNRELIDLEGNFLLFSFEGTEFVAKRIAGEKSHRERRNAMFAKKVLAGTILHPVVPEEFDIDGQKWLVARYLGRSLHETLSGADPNIAFDDFVAMIDVLLSKDVQWAGFAPRNLIPRRDGSGFWAIDWEDLDLSGRRRGTWSRLSLLKIASNWAVLFGTPDRALAFLESRVLPRPTLVALDEFETSWRSLMLTRPTVKVTQSECLRITFRSEAPLPNLPQETMTPQEIGHLVTDLFGSPIDVFYAAQMTRMRDVVHDSVTGFLRYFTAVVGAALLKQDTHRSVLQNVRYAAAKSIIGLTDPAHDWSFGRAERDNIPISALNKLSKLSSKQGLQAAFMRANLVETVISLIYRSIVCNFMGNSECQLLLRGSLAQGLLSKNSDVDFEISARVAPNGYRAHENLVCSLLTCLGIASEASASRPQEPDIEGPGWSREAMEWLELRDIASGKPWPHHQLPRDFRPHRTLGEYERGHLLARPKHVWFAVRSLIARAAAKYGEQSPLTIRQLQKIGAVKGRKSMSDYNNLLASALEAYENGDCPACVGLVPRLKVLGDLEDVETPEFIYANEPRSPWAQF